MKKGILFLLTFLVSLVGVQKAQAQVINAQTGDVLWYGSTLDAAVEACEHEEYVYLYNVDQDKFLNVGGAYGVHAMLSSVGMRVKIAKHTVQSWMQTVTYYTIMGRIDNEAQGSYLSPNGVYKVNNNGTISGLDIYMDRVGETTDGDQYSRPNWRFTVTQGSETVNGQSYTTYTYKIYNNDRSNPNYLGTNGATSSSVYFVEQNGNNNKWRIITEQDYLAAMDKVTWGEVDLGSLVKDADFGRDNMDGRYWVWSTNGEGGTPETGTDAEHETYTKDGWVVTGDNIHWHQRNQDKMCNGYELSGRTITPTIVGTNVMSSGQTDHDGFRNSYAEYFAAEIYNEVNSLTQKLTLSKVDNLKEGLYKLTAQALYYDDGDGTTNDDVSFFVVKTTNNGVPSEQRLPIIPMNKVSNNITPHSGVSAGKVFDSNDKAYLLEFFVELQENTLIEMGIETTKAKGWTVIGNIHLYAHGKQVVCMDEDWTDRETISYVEHGQTTTKTGNPYEITGCYNADYSYPTTLYLQRTFTLNKWNTICLPFDINGSSIRQAFGEDCCVSRLKGVRGTRILFEKVDLDLEGMSAGVPYIIRPTREPDVASGVEHTEEVGNGGEFHTITIEGPVYFIPGMTGQNLSSTVQALPALQVVEGEKTTPDDVQLYFEGTYYKKTVGSTTSQYDNYVISKGTMYHLTNTKPVTLYASYAYLYHDKDASGSAKTFTMSINGVDEGENVMTAIEGITPDAVSIEDSNVYTLNGQKLGGNSLQKGIYIKNGKKFVVK
jgi:hypothetical protein